MGVIFGIVVVLATIYFTREIAELVFEFIGGLYAWIEGALGIAFWAIFALIVINWLIR